MANVLISGRRFMAVQARFLRELDLLVEQSRKAAEKTNLLHL